MAVNPTDCAVEKGLKTCRPENAAMLAPFEICNHPAGGIVSRGTGHSAVGMCTGAAEVKIFLRGCDTGPLWDAGAGRKSGSGRGGRNPQFSNFTYCVKQSERQDC